MGSPRLRRARDRGPGRGLWLAGGSANPKSRFAPPSALL